MDEEIITEKETAEEQAEDMAEESETNPEPEPMPDYAGMIGEVSAKLEELRDQVADLRNQIEELRNGFAIMVENGATIQDDSQLPGPLPEPQNEGFTYTPLQDLDYSF